MLELAGSRSLLSILGIGVTPLQSASRVVAAVDIVVIEKRAGIVAGARSRGRVDLGSSRFLLGAGGSRRCSNDGRRSSWLGLLGAGGSRRCSNDGRRSSRLGLLGARANRNNDVGRGSLRSRGRGNDDNAAGRRGRHGSGSLASRLDRGRGRFLGTRRGSIHRAAGAVLVKGVRGSKRHVSGSNGNGNPLLDNLGGDVEASVLEDGTGRGHESARGGENQRGLHFC